MLSADDISCCCAVKQLHFGKPPALASYLLTS